MSSLGTAGGLPERHSKAGVAPLWPVMRNMLPHDVPKPVTTPDHWSYEAIRPSLHRAGRWRALITHHADADSFLVRIHNRSLQEKLDYCEERER